MEPKFNRGEPTLAAPRTEVTDEAKFTVDFTITASDDIAMDRSQTSYTAKESFDALAWPDLVDMQTCDVPKAGGPTLRFAMPSPVVASDAVVSSATKSFIDPLGIIPQWLTTISTDDALSPLDGTEPRVALRPERHEPWNVDDDSEITSRWTPSLSAEENAASGDIAGYENRSLAMWGEPSALLDALDNLAWECSCSDWAVRVSILVRELTSGQAASPEEAEALLSELRGEVQRVDELIPQIDDYRLASEVRRLRHAVVRRIAVWNFAVRLESRSGSALATTTVDTEPLAAVLAKVDALVDKTGEPSGWREYLMLDSLGVLAQTQQGHVTERSRELADLVLARLDANSLNSQQRQIVTTGPIASLGGSLQAWAARSVAAAEFLQALERYETTGLPSDAANVAQLSNRLQWSEDDDQQQLASTVTRYYRNANLRIAITEKLIARMLPDEQLQWQPVRDTIVGVPVRGNSSIRTNFGIELLPDDERLRMMLDISGVVSANTRAGGGWGSVFNSSKSRYSVRQPLAVGQDGLQLGTPSASAKSRVRLRRVETKLDSIPLLGTMAKSIVRHGQEKRGPDARRESERKIRRRALQEASKEVGARLSDAEQRFEQEVIKPLTALGLDPEIIEMKTTDERFTVRTRIAGVNQLGSHTPRPRAPSDSLASIQLHQSAVNNLFERLDLNGRSLSLAALHAHVLKKLGRDPQPAPEAMPEDVYIRFAAHDAVHVECRDDRVRVTLAIEELSKSPRRWRKFAVHVNYRPADNVADARLDREGTIQLEGRRLNLGSQIALRGVFSKIFADQGLSLLPNRIKTDPRFADIEMTQLTIEDGWIAVALGPKRSIAKALSTQSGETLAASNTQ